MQLLLGDVQVPIVRGVDYEDDSIDLPAVLLPALPESRLASEVPNFHINLSFFDFAEVKADGGDGVFIELVGR